MSVELIKSYLVVYPELNDLVLVLKMFIYESKLFAPYLGGLSSYGLFLMIVAFVQMEEARVGNDNWKGQDVDLRIAELLIGFLKFYGFRMDYITQKIIVNEPKQNYSKNIVYNS